MKDLSGASSKMLGLWEQRGHQAPRPGWSQAMGVVQGWGPSGDSMVGLVVGMAGWGVFLERLAKGTVIEKSGRGRKIWGRQWSGCGGSGQKTAPE